MKTEKKERLRGKIKILIKELQPRDEEQASEIFLDLLEDLDADIERLERSKATSHDVTLLVQEVKAGFTLMEKRFEAVDKRFEAADKRFEDLIHYMDKRFEDMNRRFSSLQWFMGIGFTLLALLISAINYIGKMQ